jgi:hypothetical protein
MSSSWGILQGVPYSPHLCDSPRWLPPAPDTTQGPAPSQTAQAADQKLHAQEQTHAMLEADISSDLPRMHLRSQPTACSLGKTRCAAAKDALPFQNTAAQSPNVCSHRDEGTGPSHYQGC